MKNVKYISDITRVQHFPKIEAGMLKEVTEKFPFGANDYYLGLVDREDEEDPIRRIIVPSPEELESEDWGRMDPSGEALYSVISGIQHKYPDTALFLLSSLCFGRCRFCFRKRLFMEYREHEVLRDYSEAFEYIREHTEINNVLLTGGDPLRLETASLRKVLTELRKIDHVQIIRIGTKSVAFNPYRIINDPELPKLISEFSTPLKRMYFMVQFNHPREITGQAIEAVDILIKSGAILCNQTPLIRGVNDDPEVLAELLKKLSYIGVSPYYVFQMRPAVGNKPYALTLVKAYQVFREAQRSVSGTAKRATFAMSHRLGKIEVVGLDEAHIYMRHHRAPDDRDSGQLIIARRNDYGYWLDDLDVVYGLGKQLSRC